jgi:hypothetical protein
MILLMRFEPHFDLKILRTPNYAPTYSRQSAPTVREDRSALFVFMDLNQQQKGDRIG